MRDRSRPATKRPTRADMLLLRQSGAHDSRLQTHAKSQGTRAKGSGFTKETPRNKQQTAAGKRQGPHAACGTVRGASNEDAAARNLPGVNSAVIRVYINVQGQLALLDTG